MSRPRKAVVDYFPHICKHGRTMQIIKGKFGNDGRAFWWTLLEILGSTENHFYDTRNPLDWEFLLSETLVDETTASDILNTLAVVGSIDKSLWDNGVIWCQHFMDGIADVYKKRKVSLPQKPIIEPTPLQNADPPLILSSGDRNRGLGDGNPAAIGIPDSDNPQRRGEERIGEDSKEKTFCVKPEKPGLTPKEKPKKRRVPEALGSVV